MAPTQTLLSPSELAYLHTSLSQIPPIRSDLRTATDFRPLIAESGILPTANGSARVCFSDGTEAIVGVKAEVEKTAREINASDRDRDAEGGADVDGNDDDVEGAQPSARAQQGSAEWIDVSVDIPGMRDDDELLTFLSSMLKESLESSTTLHSMLYLNDRWHWRLFVDILLLSAPLSYPLPLLSLTTHHALLDTALPRRTSDQEDDPLFDDDWAAAIPLYGQDGRGPTIEKPPVTLLVMTAGDNAIFDPSREELAVADSIVAVSLATQANKMGALRTIAIRTIDPPSRLTPLGLPQAANTSTSQTSKGGTGAVDVQGPTGAVRDKLVEDEKGRVWNPPRGGIKRQLLTKVLKMCTEKGGVGEEVLEGLARVES